MKLTLAGLPIRNPFDRHDLVIFGGLGMLAHGVAAISRPWAWIVTGALLFALGMVGLLRLSRPPHHRSQE